MRQFSVGWWEDVARSIFGYQEHRVLELEDAVRAAAVLEADRPEWGFLKTEHRYVLPNLTEPAIAGEFAFIGLQNPANSGILGVIEGMLSGSGNEVQCRVGPIGTGFDAAIRLSSKSGVIQDTRLVSATFPGGPAPGLTTIQGTATAAELTNISSPFGRWLPSNMSLPGPLWLWLPGHQAWSLVVGPGTFAAFFDILANNALAGVTIRWRERPLWKGERA